MTTSGTEKVSIPDGRKQTDESLGAERAKTDRSLAQSKRSLEDQADEAVVTSREAADQTRSRIRMQGDNSRETDSSGPEAAKLEERLQEERQRFDDALNTERRERDDVLEHERKQKQSAEEALLRTERTNTDRDLTSERNWTDNEYLRAANLLSDEITAHLATRTSLTSRKELIAIVSHDLKNPLATIAMGIEVLRSAVLSGTEQDTILEYIDLIGNSSREGLRLINDILDMGRMAAGKVLLHVAPHEFNELIQYSFKTFQLLAAKKTISLHSSFTDGNAIILCDRDRIGQVLSNLVSNALKFTPAGGQVTLSSTYEKNQVKVSVTDTGLGVPVDMRERIFERFSQIDQQNRTGLGLGLYISKIIVEAHRGRIWVDSRPGKGSTFHFTLPISDKLLPKT